MVEKDRINQGQIKTNLVKIVMARVVSLYGECSVKTVKWCGYLKMSDMSNILNTKWCPICNTDQYVTKQGRRITCETCENDPQKVMQCRTCKGKGYRVLQVWVCLNAANHKDGYLEIGD